MESGRGLLDEYIPASQISKSHSNLDSLSENHKGCESRIHYLDSSPQLRLEIITFCKKPVRQYLASSVNPLLLLLVKLPSLSRLN